MAVKRTMKREDIQKLKEYAARMAGNGIFVSGYQGAVEFLQFVCYAEKGEERRELTPDEASNMIHQGGFR